MLLGEQRVTYIRFRRAQLELNKGYPSLLYPCGTTAAFDHWLVQDKTVYHFTVLDCAANLFDDSNIPQIDIVCGFRINDLQHRVNSDRT